jgi:predicted house-cleaning noncanonical NTP pyrophosphatase (MazG superfamily)
MTSPDRCPRVNSPDNDGAKLVRDKIPEIIRRASAEPATRTATPEEFGGWLRRKLVEEVDEFLASDDPSELADILEVLRALANDLGVDADELECLRAAKEAERGGFNDRLVWLGNREACPDWRDAAAGLTPVEPAELSQKGDDRG